MNILSQSLQMRRLHSDKWKGKKLLIKTSVCSIHGYSPSPAYCLPLFPMSIERLQKKISVALIAAINQNILAPFKNCQGDFGPTFQKAPEYKTFLNQSTLFNFQGWLIEFRISTALHTVTCNCSSHSHKCLVRISSGKKRKEPWHWMHLVFFFLL